MMKKRLKKLRKCSPVSSASSEHGFTLIELLLYSAMVGSLLTGVVLFFTTSVDSRIKTQSISEVNQQGTATMEYLTAAIRNATSITAPASGASGAALTLTVPTGSLSPTVFDLSSGALEVKEGAAAVIPLTNSKVQISNLTFTNLSRAGTPGVVQISFVISRVNPGNRNEFDYQKTFISSAARRWP